MPVKYLILENGYLVLERWTGNVTHQELLTHKMLLAEEPGIEQGASVLSDCSNARFETEAERVQEISAVDSHPNQARIGRYAFLVSRDAYDRMQMFSAQMGKQGKTTIVFASLDIACKWLGIDTEEIRGHLKTISK